MDEDLIETQVTVRVRVSREAWERNYGSSAGVRALKANIKEYATNVVVEQLRSVGVWANDEES